MQILNTLVPLGLILQSRLNGRLTGVSRAVFSAIAVHDGFSTPHTPTDGKLVRNGRLICTCVVPFNDRNLHVLSNVLCLSSSLQNAVLI